MKEKIKFIKELAQSMNENKIETVKYEENNFEIMLSKKKKEKNVVVSAGAVPQNVVSNAIPTQEKTVEVQESKPASEENQEIEGNKIISPMVGTFYSAPSPNMPPFVKEGVKVEKGQTLCIVEAMKLMNEVKSTVSGTVKKILVKDGDAIKKGQTLMIIG